MTGAKFAKIINGFGCKILAFDICKNEELQDFVEYVEFDELCQKSDIISLHCPLNSSTEYLLNKKSFALMKNGVFIVNTARGKVINTQDLLAALDSGKVGAAALDVYEFEKDLFFQNHSQNELNLIRCKKETMF